MTEPPIQYDTGVERARPCPFCDETEVDVFVAYSPDNLRAVHACVACGDCGSTGPKVPAREHDAPRLPEDEERWLRTEAIRTWNER